MKKNQERKTERGRERERERERESGEEVGMEKIGSCADSEMGQFAIDGIYVL
jgi:hypothetical protein